MSLRFIFLRVFKLKLSIILNIRNKINLSLAIIYDLTLFKSL